MHSSAKIFLIFSITFNQHWFYRASSNPSHSHECPIDSYHKNTLKTLAINRWAWNFWHISWDSSSNIMHPYEYIVFPPQSLFSWWRTTCKDRRMLGCIAEADFDRHLMQWVRLDIMAYWKLRFQTRFQSSFIL